MANVTQGRGAFTRVGKDNGSPLYSYIAGKPQDGSTPDKDDNYRAVALGVKAYQLRLNEMGAPAALKIPEYSGNGFYGPLTTRGVAWAQKQLKTGLTSGVIGSTFSRAVWKETLAKSAAAYKIQAQYLYGIMIQESGGDPGAVGYATPDDLGLFQVNMKDHGPGTPDNITPDQAHDPVFSSRYTARRFADAYQRYDGKGEELRLSCAIAQHNAPAWALSWYRTGSPPNSKIQDYVTKVMTYAKLY